jgi:hypothetical protein
MRDFMILKRLNVNLHPPKPTIVKEVLWQPPLDHWVKCNTDGASTSSTSSCGGIFRNHNANLLCCFAENIGRKSAFKAELCGAMRAIELANYRNWKNLWLESDSTLVVLAFKSIDLVPWELSNRWKNCLKITSGMNFVWFPMFIEKVTNVRMVWPISVFLLTGSLSGMSCLRRLVAFLLIIDWVSLVLGLFIVDGGFGSVPLLLFVALSFYDIYTF